MTVRRVSPAGAVADCSPLTVGLWRVLGIIRRAEAPNVVEHLMQADAGDQRHGVVADAILLAVIEHGHDVGMVQPRRRAGLGVEPPQIGRVGPEPGMHDLERHPALERLVLGLVDNPHAAPRR